MGQNTPFHRLEAKSRPFVVPFAAQKSPVCIKMSLSHGHFALKRTNYLLRNKELTPTKMFHVEHLLLKSLKTLQPALGR
jgi:hypothetical protein